MRCGAACREMFKEGAHFIKVMANGGVSSPNDPIHSIQFSREEIAAMVEEAENAGLYVAGASSIPTGPSAARRARRPFAGALQPDRAGDGEAGGQQRAASRCRRSSPTRRSGSRARRFGLGAGEFAKIEAVRSGGLQSLAIMRDAGLPMAFGSDLLGGLRKYHCMEFELLAKVLTPAEIIRSATLVGASSAAWRAGWAWRRALLPT